MLFENSNIHKSIPKIDFDPNDPAWQCLFHPVTEIYII